MFKLFKRNTLKQLKNYKEIVNYWKYQISTKIMPITTYDESSQIIEYTIDKEYIDNYIKNNFIFTDNKNIFLGYVHVIYGYETYIGIFGIVFGKYVFIKCDNDYNPQLRIIIEE